jgi:hypothetical protein
MIEIKDLLVRFNSILLGEEGKKDSVRNIISEVVGIEIKREDFKIRNNIIYLNIKPIYKSEIFLKKDKICVRLQECFNTRAPKEIR